MKSATTLEGSSSRKPGLKRSTPPDDVMLVVAWSAKEPERIGEVLALPLAKGAVAPFVFGRGGEQPDDRLSRVSLHRQRPGANESTGPLDNPFLSRAHLKITRDGDGLRVENLGKRPLLVRGEEVSAGVVHPGDAVEIEGLILFYCARRASLFPALKHRDGSSLHRFGGPDGHGLVGESAPAWDLRDQIAFFAKRHGHVLVTGESGTGKELVAQAIHATSPRGAKKLVARNAATLPPGIIDAELFGNVANYPNVGMPERPGIIGEADGGTLFLDEIGELASDLQTHLLRVLDQRGEYQRLGEARRRVSNLRLIGATNRPVDSIKQDLAARMGLRLHVAGLNERREDIPLLVRHLLASIAAADAQIGERFFEGWDGRRGEPRLTFELVTALLLHEYRTHVRELEAVLWRAIGTSTGGELELTDSLRAWMCREPELGDETGELSAARIRAALDRHGGVRERAWRDLGLPSRHALHRLMKKHAIDSGTRED